MSLHAGDRAGQPGWGEALRIWWLITWRTIVLLILINVSLLMAFALFGGVGMGMGMHGARALADHPTTTMLILPIQMGVSIGVGVWVVRMALSKRYRGFRIRLVPTDSPGDDGDARFHT